MHTGSLIVISVTFFRSFNGSLLHLLDALTKSCEDIFASCSLTKSLSCCSELFVTTSSPGKKGGTQQGYYLDAGKCFSTSGGLFNGSIKMPLQSQGLSIVLR